MNSFDDQPIPPPDEQDAFFYWVWCQANKESEDMPETQLVTPEGESLEV